MKTGIFKPALGGVAIALLAFAGLAQAQDGTHHPPSVTIVHPTNDAVFVAPTNIPIQAAAHDSDGWIRRVCFFANGHLLRCIEGPTSSGHYGFVWSNAVPGGYTLVARATDNSGLSQTSAPVNIRVIADDGHTNRPPVVRIVHPNDGDSFTAPAEVRICAEAKDFDGFVTEVEFFAGTHSLGVVVNEPASVGSGGLFCLTWSNAPPGHHVLRAKATDNHGAVSVSPPIGISVKRDIVEMPKVTVRATKPFASETADSAGRHIGVFTVYRSHGTNVDMTVYYSLGGTASNGVDYVELPGTVVIPRGAFSANVLVVPIDDDEVEGTETVVLRIDPIACIAIYPPPPECYQVGSPSHAVVFIEDNDGHTNEPPHVRITSPTNHSVFVAPADIEVSAEARDADGAVARVDFFANHHPIGRATAPPYSIVWSNARPGFYILKAVAIDDAGARGISEPVRISVVGTHLPPDTNRPPIVTIAAKDGIAVEEPRCWRWHTETDSGTVTNELCRTNIATFVVTRSGSTNADLTVYYSIAGTASNGVDYVSLPGFVAIPAGQRQAFINIVPIDDNEPECVETVVLSLVSLEADPPPYVVGWPGRAAAIIVDHDEPRPETCCLEDHCFHLRFEGSDGTTYRLEISHDLKIWLAASTGLSSDGSVHFVDPDAAEYPSRFYRIVPEHDILYED